MSGECCERATQPYSSGGGGRIYQAQDQHRVLTHPPDRLCNFCAKKESSLKIDIHLLSYLSYFPQLLVLNCFPPN